MKTAANLLRATAFGLLATLATAPASAADKVPSAFSGKLIYAVPARMIAAPTPPEAGPATYDVFIDGRTGYAFVRAPQGWTFVRDTRKDLTETGPTATN
ncbi:MAG: hypothetical protein FGM40_05130 [Rhodocyclaceae bacterium]|nr:hypothetical protein [Rhodocyclaceae bacterium]